MLHLSEWQDFVQHDFEGGSYAHYSGAGDLLYHDHVEYGQAYDVYCAAEGYVSCGGYCGEDSIQGYHNRNRHRKTKQTAAGELSVIRNNDICIG